MARLLLDSAGRVHGDTHVVSEPADRARFLPRVGLAPGRSATAAAGSAEPRAASGSPDSTRPCPVGYVKSLLTDCSGLLEPAGEAGLPRPDEGTHSASGQGCGVWASKGEHATRKGVCE